MKKVNGMKNGMRKLILARTKMLEISFFITVVSTFVLIVILIKIRQSLEVF